LIFSTIFKLIRVSAIVVTIFGTKINAPGMSDLAAEGAEFFGGKQRKSEYNFLVFSNAL
jgi:hypothetical protein